MELVHNFVKLWMELGGQNSLLVVLGSLSCLMQFCWFSPPQRRIFPVERIFPLELTWILTPFPKISFRWEYKPRSSLCKHAFHHTNTKDPDIHVLEGECWQQKHTQHAPSLKTDCGYLNSWIKKNQNGHIGKNLTQNGVSCPAFDQKYIQGGKKCDFEWFLC